MSTKCYSMRVSRWMLSERGQEQAASAIADAALEYLQHYDRRTRTSQR